MPFRIRVPASTSNLGPGFDCLGLALDLELCVEVATAPGGVHVATSGSHSAAVPHGADNLVLACMGRVLRRAGLPQTGLRVTIHNDIPMGRGLGSSAAATVAGLLAGHLLARGAPPEPETLLGEAVEIEGHPDNAAPAVFGGLVASAVGTDRVHTIGFAFPATWSIVLVIPEVEVATEAARRILPPTVPLADAVFNVAHLALFLGALGIGRYELLREAMRDRLHQEHRLRLVPGLGPALAALASEPGCIGAVLSGSGPTLLGFFEAPRPTAGDAAVGCLAAAGVRAAWRTTAPRLRGAHWQACG